jgi:uncharacterized delta-60 repeat protein
VNTLSPYSSAFQTDEKLIISGQHGGGNSYLVARIGLTGALDTSFNTTGYNSFNNGGIAIEGLSVDSNGRIIGLGRRSGGASNLDIYRFSSSGTFDTTFGTAGLFSYPIPTHQNPDNWSTPLSSGGYILSGYQSSSGFSYTLKLNSSGAIDTTFATAGIFNGNSGGAGGDGGKNIIELSNGKLLVGFTAFVGGPDYALGVERLNSDGSLDTTFGVAGYCVVNYGAGTQSTFHIAQQPDGKIILCGKGFPGPDAQIARVHSNGTLDTTFNTTGRWSIDMGGANDSCDMVIVQPDGKLWFAGETMIAGTPYVLTGRLNTNGTLDTSYGTGGTFYTTFGLSINSGGADGVVWAYQRANGKIVLFTSTTDGRILVSQIQ